MELVLQRDEKLSDLDARAGMWRHLVNVCVLSDIKWDCR